MPTPRRHPIGAMILALLVAILIQIPFAIAFLMPRYGFGVPGIGATFFAPAFAITRMFSPLGSTSVLATMTVQTIITFVPVFWLVTWRRRAPLSTLARVLTFVSAVTVAAAIAIPLEQRHDAHRQASQINGKSPVLSSIQRLNGSLAFFKKRYGELPETLSQLDFPPDENDVDSRHSGLIQFPLPMQDFFDFTYTRQGSGYELRVDGKPGEGWQLYHYCTEDSATIRFDTKRDHCEEGTVVYSKPH